MSKVKVSKAQMFVLKRLLDGFYVYYQNGNRYTVGTSQRVQPSTVGVLKRRGLIVRSGVGPGDKPRYTITPTGRALVEQTAGEEG